MFHDLFIAVAFIAMVAAPAMVATLGGKKEYQPDPEPEQASRLPVASPEPSGKVIRPQSAHFIPPRHVAAGRPASPATLPMRARGMMNR